MMEWHITRVSEAREKPSAHPTSCIRAQLARLSGPMSRNRLFKLRPYLCDNAESDYIPTLFREVYDVGLGYTPMAHHLRCSKVEKFGRERDRQRVGWAGMKRDHEASPLCGRMFSNSSYAYFIEIDLQVMTVRTKPLLRPLCLRTETSNRKPEFLRMVRNRKMNSFVNHDVPKN
jgi:hypothetical protein